MVAEEVMVAADTTPTAVVDMAADMEVVDMAAVTAAVTVDRTDINPIEEHIIIDTVTY